MILKLSDNFSNIALILSNLRIFWVNSNFFLRLFHPLQFIIFSNPSQHSGQVSGLSFLWGIVRQCKIGEGKPVVVACWTKEARGSKNWKDCWHYLRERSLIRFGHNIWGKIVTTFWLGGREYTFFIGNSIFHLSLELLTKFWKTCLKVA